MFLLPKKKKKKKKKWKNSVPWNCLRNISCLYVGCHGNRCFWRGSIWWFVVWLKNIFLMPYCFVAFIMPPTSKKLREHIGFGLSVRPSVHASIRSSKTVHARVLKFHLWIPHGKIIDTRFFLVRVISLSGVMPLWKNQNEIWCMPYLMNCAC